MICVPLRQQVNGLDIQKATATNNGTKNPIFTGSLGEYRGVVLHKHNKVTRFSDYGAGLTWLLLVQFSWVVKQWLPHLVALLMACVLIGRKNGAITRIA
jgi:hypothetical protein